MADDSRKKFKSKSSSHFPNFEASNAWQMGHNSRQGFILGQELLLDFAAWIDLTSNADNLPLISVALEVREHILLLYNMLVTYGFIKALWCLSTTGQATRYLKTMLKILFERAVMQHFSLLWRSIETHVLCVSINNSLYKKSPQIPAPYTISSNRYLDFSKNLRNRMKKKMSDLVSNWCLGKTNSNVARSVPYPLALTKQ